MLLRQMEFVETTKSKAYLFYLFNDMLLVGKTDKKKLLKTFIGSEVKYKDHYPFNDLEISEAENCMFLLLLLFILFFLLFSF